MTNHDAIAILTDCLDKADYKSGAYGIALKMAIMALKQKPRKGHWIIHPNGIYSHLVCDQCVTRAPYDYPTNYCPYCGSDNMNIEREKKIDES